MLAKIPGALSELVSMVSDKQVDFLAYLLPMSSNVTNKISFLIRWSLPESNGRKAFTYPENLCLVPVDLAYSCRVWSYRARKYRVCLEPSESILRIRTKADDLNKDNRLEGVFSKDCRRFDLLRRDSPKRRDQNRSKIDFLKSACNCSIISKNQPH